MAWTDFFKSEGKPIVQELVESKSLPEDAKPQSVRTIEIDKRVSPSWLEKLYVRDADTFAAINHRVRTFMSSNYMIKADSPQVEKWYKDFLKNARFDIILRKIVLHCSIYGNAWVELVKNSNGQIVGFDHIDPKVMDFARDSNGRILWDKYNNPQYYVQVISDGGGVPEGRKHRQVSHTSDKMDVFSGTGIRLERDEVAHFTMHTIGDQLDGIGLIEPMYNALLSKIQMEKDWGHAVKKAASPLVVAKAGDELHRPTDTMVDKLMEKIRDIKSTSVLAIPYYHDIEYKTADIQSLEPNLSYYVDKISASTGVPKPYVIGSGEQTPRSTFKGLNLGYERDIQEMQKSISYDAEQQMFHLISETYKISEVPRLEFETPSIEYMDARAGRYVDYANSGLLIPDKGIRDHVRRMENLPEEPEDLEDVVPKKIDEKKRNEEAEDEDEEVKKDGK